MKRSQLKKKLKDKVATIGSWITMGNGDVAEIMSQAGFEWLTLDLEHSSMTFDQCKDLIRIISLHGVSPLVRVGANDPLIIKRVMDAGAHGVIVPMVNGRSDAENAVQSVKYPPRGKRGVGLYRAQRYGTAFNDYVHWVARESVVIVQIEHHEGVANLGEILSVEGVDGFIVGPYDLSASLGMPGQFEKPAVKDALATIRKTAANHKVSSGFHVVPPEPDMVRQKIKEKYTFIAYSVDFLLLGEMARRGLKQIRITK